MNYTINTLDYQHLGFLLLVPENEHEPFWGDGMVKLQTTDADILTSPEAQVLQSLCQPFTWQIEQDTMLFSHEDDIIAKLQGEYLQVGTVHYLIHDLTGAI